MTCEITDHGGCFEISLSAENISEAATLCQFAANRTNELRHAFTYFGVEGRFNTSVVIGARKNRSNTIPRP